MKLKKLLTFAGAATCLLLPVAQALAVEGWASTRVTEFLLNRGITAQHTGQSAYISWRLLETDQPGIGFDIYRKVGTGTPQKLNTSAVITQTTDYVDTTAPTNVNVTYYVVPIVNGQSGTPSEETTVNSATSGEYFSFDTEGTVGKVAIGDLDGDGAYDFVVRTPAGSIDPHSSSWHKSSAPTYKLRAYKSDGTYMWEYDMGQNIEKGIWYSPYIVYDFDGNGKAEVAAKTAPLTPSYANTAGEVKTGPEYLSIIDGMTGNIVHSVDWPSRSGFENYNHESRNQLGLAFLDGKTPCIIAARGTYELMKAQAFQFNPNSGVAGELEPLWYWDSDNETAPGQWEEQGAHSMRSANVDDDIGDEVFLGACVLDDDGTGLWTTGLDHPDHVYVGDLNPERPGLEVYAGHENERSGGLGINQRDAETGQLLWKIAGNVTTIHIHDEGLVSDIDPDQPGMEAWGGEKAAPTRYYHSADGDVIDHNGLFFDSDLDYGAVYWDADLQREVIVRNMIYSFPENDVTSIYHESFGSSTSLNDWTLTSTDNLAEKKYASSGKGIMAQQPGTGQWTLRHTAGFTVEPDQRYRMVIDHRAFEYINQVAINVAGYNGSTLVYADLLDLDLTIEGPGSIKDTVTASLLVPLGVNRIVPEFVGSHTDPSGAYVLHDIQLLRDDNPGRGHTNIAGTELAWVDLHGDWREEVITTIGNEVRVYSTTIPAADRRVTLMQDPIYRADVASVSMGYPQVPTTSYCLSDPVNQTPVVLPAAYWTFDNTGNDQSGSNLHASLQNGATYSTDRIAGSHSLSLDGTNDHAILSPNGGSDFLHSTFTERTMACWVKVNSTSPSQVIYDESNIQDGIGVRIVSGTLTARVKKGGISPVTLSTSYSSTDWNHVAVVYNNGEFALYLNGVLEASASTGLGTIGARYSAAAAGARINADLFGSGDGHYLGGLIDDMSVFTEALTAQEIAEIAGLPPQPPALEASAWWFFENNGNDASDNNLDASLQNGATFSTNSQEGDYSLSLDGVNDYAILSPTGGTDLFHTTFTQRTMACWIKANSTSGSQVIYDDGNTAEGIGLRILNGTLTAQVKDGGSTGTISANFASTAWHHVALVYDNGEFTLYIDGNVGASASTGFGTIGTRNSAAAAGARVDADVFGLNTGHYFGGLIDSLVVFEEALTEAELETLP